MIFISLSRFHFLFNHSNFVYQIVVVVSFYSGEELILASNLASNGRGPYPFWIL